MAAEFNPQTLLEAARRFGRLNLPPVELCIARESDGVVRVHDRLRGYSVALTPEEWVRQHFVEMLIAKLGYPPAMMANEVGVELNGTSKRCDTVVYSPRGLRPLAIVEYKAPSIRLTQKVFDQIVRYNMVLRVPWLMVSNGLRHYCCRVDYDARRVAFLHDLPTYVDLES